MGDIHCRQIFKVEKILKLKIFQKEMPYHILGKKNLKIGFNPKLITKILLI